MKAKCVGLFVGLSLVVFAVSAQNMAWTDSQVGWVISGAKVIDKGKTTTTASGTQTIGYKVQGKAVSQLGDMLPSGQFIITVDAFSPSKDSQGQKAGNWYVNAKWTISATKVAAAPPARLPTPQKVDGTLSAELWFNPATTRGNMEAYVMLPQGVGGGIWATGAGLFKGNQLFEGNLAAIGRVGQKPLASLQTTGSKR